MTVAGKLQIRRAQVRGATAAEAARRLAAEIVQPDASVAFVFGSCRYDQDELARELRDGLAPVPVFGCTSAVELGPRGFEQGAVTGMTLRASGLRVGAACGRGLVRGGLSAGRRAALEALAALGVDATDLDRQRRVAVCLVDWRAQAEESFIAGAAATAPGVAFVGGSSSDLPSCQPSRVYFGGEAVPDAGLVIMFESKIPFKVLVSEHMIPIFGAPRVVVTRTDADNRLVHELNGRPALDVFLPIITENLGRPVVPTDELVGRFPFGYYVQGRVYVRSVMRVEGTSLRFACAVDRGTVLVPMRAGAMIPTTQRSLESAAQEVGGKMRALLAFSCYGRYLESQADGLTEQVGQVMTDYPVIGFSSYGEQVNGLHVNHTLTGLAFGDGDG